MRVGRIYIASALAPLVLIGGARADMVVSESFESGDLKAGAENITWGNPNRTSLVARDPDRGDLVVYNKNGSATISMGSEQHWSAKDGNISLRFAFPPGKNSWSEQRFALDSARPELWIRFWLRVPPNFEHRSTHPSNNKLFALWMDGYESKGAGPTVIWEFWPDDEGGSKLAYHYSEGGHQGANSHKQLTPFISYPGDQGRWMQLVFHVKAASRPRARDGIIQAWRRWEHQESFRRLHNDRQADIALPAEGPRGWKAGYLMGWSNPGYKEATDWLLDDLKISENSLLKARSPAETTAPTPSLESREASTVPRVPIL